jgi:hypothetical protein
MGNISVLKVSGGKIFSSMFNRGLGFSLNISSRCKKVSDLKEGVWELFFLL